MSLYESLIKIVNHTFGFFNFYEVYLMNQKGLSVKSVVAIGIGAAIYVILARFTSIPTGIPNTNI